MCSPTPTLYVLLALIHSYEHQGAAQVECVDGCRRESFSFTQATVPTMAGSAHQTLHSKCSYLRPPHQVQASHERPDMGAEVQHAQHAAG